jgi:RHS repeat-associated protein
VIASATPTTLTTDSTWDTVSGGSLPLNINDAATSSLTPGSTTNVSYIYGDLLFGGTAPIEQITTTASGSTAVFLVANQTGVQGVFSSSGATDELAVYSPYGKQTIKSGSDVTPFGFQGSYTDSTGLIYLIDRYYDPSTDQFMSVDPLFDATNQPYVFLGDDPLNSTDPLGDVAGSGRWVACLVLAATINCLSLFRANEPGGGPGPGEISAKTFDDTKVKNPKLAKRHEPGKSSFWGDVGGVFLAPSRALHWVVSRIPAPPQLRFPHVGPFPLPIPLPVFAAG